MRGRLIAAGHHGPLPRAALRVERALLRPRGPRRRLVVHAIPATAAEPTVAAVDTSGRRAVRRLGGVARPAHGPGRGLLLRRHDPEGARVRPTRLDDVQGALREEHEAARGADVRSPAVRVRTAVPRQEAGVSHPRLIIRGRGRARGVRATPRPPGPSAGIARRRRCGPRGGPPTRPPCARTTSAVSRRRPSPGRAPGATRSDRRTPDGSPLGVPGGPGRSARRSGGRPGGTPIPRGAGPSPSPWPRTRDPPS